MASPCFPLEVDAFKRSPCLTLLLFLLFGGCTSLSLCHLHFLCFNDPLWLRQIRVQIFSHPCHVSSGQHTPFQSLVFMFLSFPIFNQQNIFFFPPPPFSPCEGHQPTSFDVLVVTLLPGSVGLGLLHGLHLPRSPVPNPGCRSYLSQKNWTYFFFFKFLNKNKATAQLEIWKKMTINKRLTMAIFETLDLQVLFSFKMTFFSNY